MIDRKVSQAVDYEAELGVIIGKGGRGIKAANALDHVWGYTIINDVTARDLQGLYSQWLIGKSQDTFCPMGPWAVTRDEIDLRDTKIQCWINGELRQDANTRDLIFDVPTIIATISAGVTPDAGRRHRDRDAGGGRDRLQAPQISRPGRRRAHRDLRHRRAGERIPRGTLVSGASLGRIELEIDGEGPPIVFLHGLGATSSSFQPLLDSLGGFRCIRPDLPGAGRSPAPFAPITIEALVEAVRDIIRRVAGAPAHLVGHSMGTLVAQHVAATAPDSVLSLTLFGPIGEPAEAARERLRDRASLVRRNGMIAVADAIAAAGLSTTTKTANPVAVAYVRESHLRQDADGFARSCDALAAAKGADLRHLAAADASRDRRGRPDRAPDSRSGACGQDQGR